MTTQADRTDNKTTRRPPRQRGPASMTAGVPKGYPRAHGAFETRAQDWLLGRSGRLVRLPEDLLAIAALGIPCRTCGNLIYRAGTGSDRHSIDWSRQPDGHWAAGITASCA